MTNKSECFTAIFLSFLFQIVVQEPAHICQFFSLLQANDSFAAYFDEQAIFLANLVFIEMHLLTT